MAELRYAASVERDLLEIGDYIALDDLRAAVKFVEAIRQHCSLLASSPLVGRARPDIHEAVRSFPHGAYIVFYRYDRDQDQAEVLRIWHGRRRPPTKASLGIID